MLSFDKSITLRDKVIVVLSYMMLVRFTLGIPILYFIPRSPYTNMHFNRVFFVGFLYLIAYILKSSSFPTYIIINFVEILSVIGLIQGIFGERTKWFLSDRITLTINDGRQIKLYTQIAITLCMVSIAIIV